MTASKLTFEEKKNEDEQTKMNNYEVGGAMLVKWQVSEVTSDWHTSEANQQLQVFIITSLRRRRRTRTVGSVDDDH